MDDIVKELSGTLARTAQKRRSLLNQHQKKPKAQTSIGIPRPGASTEECQQAIHSLSREISSGVSALMQLENAVVDEAIIRNLNDKINDLLTLRQRWQSCLNTITGAEGPPTEEGGGKKYFGAARKLPEARTERKRGTPQETQGPSSSAFSSGLKFASPSPQYRKWIDQSPGQVGEIGKGEFTLPTLDQCRIDLLELRRAQLREKLASSRRES